MSVLEAALDMARRGFRVFPLLPDSKKPAISEWQYAATSDEARIRAMFANGDCNYGIVCDRIAVPDIDKRNGGFETWTELRQAHQLEQHKTLVVRTHSGGLHLIYKAPEEPLKSRTHTFGQGIDLKTGAGAYIVGPGSSINGNFYEILHDRPIIDLPASLVEIARKAGRPSEKTAAAGERLADETDESVQRAERIVAEWTEPPPGERNNAAFALAARLYDLGLERITVRNLLAGASSLDTEELDVIADSASRNRQKPIGTLVTSEGFDLPQNHSKEPPTDQEDRFRLVSTAEMVDFAKKDKRPWLVENIMFEGDEAMLIGKPYGGKTYFTLDFCYHIARGLPFAGNKVSQGPVVYIAAEAQRGLNNRIYALEKHYGPLDNVPFAAIQTAPDFLHNRKDAQIVVAKIKEAEAKFGAPVNLFVVDTLSRVMPGGKENAAEDMSAVLNNVQYIRNQTGAASLVLHHPGWNGDRGRGHSNQYGNIDVEMWVADGLMTVRKLRDYKSGHEVAFKIKPVRLGWRDDGTEITACYVEASKRDGMQVQPTPAEAEMLVLADELASNQKAITIKNLQLLRSSGRGSFSAKEDAIRRLLEEAEGKNLMRKIKRGEWVRVKPEEPEESGGSKGN